MIARSFAAASALVATLWAGPLAADPAPAPAGEGREMVAERLDVDAAARVAVLDGHVRLAKGPFRISCPHVDVRYDASARVTWLRGSGGVAVAASGVKAEAPDVELDLPRQTLELRGGVRLMRGGGWITADHATIQLATSKVSMTDVKGMIPAADLGGLSADVTGSPPKRPPPSP